MPDINLLRDKQSVSEQLKKKRTDSGVEFTKPSKEKDEVKKRLKGGGVFGFFTSLFSKREKKDLPKTPKKGKIIKERIIHENRKAKPNISTSIVYPQEEKKSDALDRLYRSTESTKKIYPQESGIGSEEPRLEPKMPAVPSALDIKKEEVPKKPEAKKFFAGFHKHKTEPKAEESKNTKIVEEEASDTLDVNLIPEEILAKLQPQKKFKLLGITLGIIAVLVGLMYGYMLYRQSQIQGKIETVLDDISSVEREIAGYSDVRAEAQSLREKIDGVNQLLNSHIYWSEFLSYLEKYTLEDVYYTNLAATTKGQVTLTARAIDLKTLSNQYTIFQNANDFVESVKIDAAAIESSEEQTQGSAGFSISLEINPEIFYRNKSL